MATKKKNSKHHSNGNRPRNHSRPITARGGTDALVRPVERSSTSSLNQHLRTYSIPDLRQEHPNLTVRQVTEKSG